MKVNSFWILSLLFSTLIILVSSGCGQTETINPILTSTESDQTMTNTPTDLVIASDTSTSTQTPTATLTPTSSITPSPTTSPTAAPSPTPTVTPIGGDSGILRLTMQNLDEDTFTDKFFSLDSLEFLNGIPYIKIKRELLPENKGLDSLILFDPSSNESKKIFECPLELSSCLLSYSRDPRDTDWIFVNQYSFTDEGDKLHIYRINIETGEQNLIEEIKGGYSFQPLSDNSDGILEIFDGPARSELYLYNTETREKQLIIRESGYFCGYGSFPDHETFWYRICDYCETRFVRKEGTRIPPLKETDGILGWIDDDQFLIKTTGSSPPVCTNYGVAIANTNGLTGEWIVQGKLDRARLSPDGTILVYGTDCKNLVCKKLMMVNIFGGDPTLLIDSDYGIGGVQWVEK